MLPAKIGARALGFLRKRQARAAKAAQQFPEGSIKRMEIIAKPPSPPR